MHWHDDSHVNQAYIVSLIAPEVLPIRHCCKEVRWSLHYPQQWSSSTTTPFICCRSNKYRRLLTTLHNTSSQLRLPFYHHDRSACPGGIKPIVVLEKHTTEVILITRHLIPYLSGYWHISHPHNLLIAQKPTKAHHINALRRTRRKKSSSSQISLGEKKNPLFCFSDIKKIGSWPYKRHKMRTK